MNDPEPKDTTKLPRAKKEKHVHHFHLEIPAPLWQRMIEEQAAAWGVTTRFILEAIAEKLDRQKATK